MTRSSWNWFGGEIRDQNRILRLRVRNCFLMFVCLFFLDLIQPNRVGTRTLSEHLIAGLVDVLGIFHPIR